MAILVECPMCKKRLKATSKVCTTSRGSGCGSKIPSGAAYYWVFLRINHEPKWWRIGPSKAAAENFERKTKVEITENRYIDKVEKPKTLISDFIKDHYRPWCEVNNRGYVSKKYFLDTINTLWGKKHLDDLTYEDVARYQWQMRKAGKLVSFNRILATVSHMFTMAVKFGKIDQSPIREAKDLRFKEQARIRYLTPPEAQRLVAACSSAPHLWPIVVTALHTGARRGEILGLQVGINVDLEKRIIRFTETKNDDERHVPISATLLDVLKAVTEGKTAGDYVFCHADGSRLRSVKRSFSTALKAAGIEDLHFHDLRHTFASNLVMQGVNLYIVKELLGHKTIQMTEKYAHLAPEHRTHAIRLLDSVFGGIVLTEGQAGIDDRGKAEEPGTDPEAQQVSI